MAQQQLDYHTRKRMEREKANRERAEEQRRAARARRNAMTQGVALMEALQLIAGDESAGEYQTEYDGRMYTRCAGCSMLDSDHDSDCGYIAARALLHKLKTEEPAKAN